MRDLDQRKYIIIIKMYYCALKLITQMYQHLSTTHVVTLSELIRILIYFSTPFLYLPSRKSGARRIIENILLRENDFNNITKQI